MAAGRREWCAAVTMYNYGSPRVGNRAFVDEYNRLVPDSVRVVNGADAVPTVPALLGYRHVAHGVRVTPAGACVGEPPALQPAAQGGGAALAQLASAAAALGVGSVVDEEMAAEAAVALASLVDSAALEAHFEDNYLGALRAAVKLTGSTRGE